MSIVFVIDSDGTPLLPTHPARARKLLREGKAVVKQVVPFTIQLNRRVNDPVGSFEVGVDDGAKHVGIAIKNTKTSEIVFHAQLDHRQDVSGKVEQRRNYRRARRFRLRNRQPRYKNRIRSKIAPSIRQRKEAILRVLKDFQKRLKLTKVKVEEVSFNHSKHTYGKFFSLVEIGKTYLREQIQALGLEYEVTYGYITKEIRLNLGLSKRHSHDACAIIESNKLNGIEYYIKPRRTKIWENNPTKTCTEKNGFRHYDLVKAKNRTRGFVVGSIRSLKANRIALRTRFDDNFLVSYNKTKLLQRFGGLIYIW
jgi:hypothetical protein